MKEFLITFHMDFKIFIYYCTYLDVSFLQKQKLLCIFQLFNFPHSKN